VEQLVVIYDSDAKIIQDGCQNACN